MTSARSAAPMKRATTSRHPAGHLRAATQRSTKSNRPPITADQYARAETSAIMNEPAYQWKALRSVSPKSPMPIISRLVGHGGPEVHIAREPALGAVLARGSSREDRAGKI